MERPHNTVAVVLVNYNGTNDTNECIRSLLKSNYSEYSILVVDNGSTEPFVLASDFASTQNIICIPLSKNLGFSGGNNVGIRYAKERLGARYIMLLNNDTVVELDLLTELIAAEKRHPNCIIGGKILYYFQKNLIWYAGGEFSRKNGSLEHTKYNEENVEYNEFDREVTFITGCLMFFQSEIINYIGYLPEEEFLYAEDTDYCCRAIDHGIRLIYAPKAVIYHKVSASAKHRSQMQNYYMIRNGLYMIKMYVENKPLGYFLFTKKQIKLLLKRECKLSTFLTAFIDFLKEKKGKRDAI